MTFKKIYASLTSVRGLVLTASLLGFFCFFIFICFAIQDKSAFLIFCDISISIFSLIFAIYLLIIALVEFKPGYGDFDNDHIEKPEDRQHNPNKEGSFK